MSMHGFFSAQLARSGCQLYAGERDRVQTDTRGCTFIFMITPEYDK